MAWKAERVTTLISIATTFNRKIKNTDKKHQGFSLLEILVVLILISMVFLLIPSDNRDNARQELEEVLDEFMRMNRFCANEAILQNKVVRLRMILDSNPMEYIVEMGPDSPVLIPNWGTVEQLSLKEQEEQREERDKFNSLFQTVQDFGDLKRELPENVFFLAAMNDKSTEPLQTGEFSIYFFPDGVKDAAVLIFATNWEAAALAIPAFSHRFETLFHSFDDGSLTYEQHLDKAIEELTQQWIDIENY